MMADDTLGRGTDAAGRKVETISGLIRLLSSWSCSGETRFARRTLAKVSTAFWLRRGCRTLSNVALDSWLHQAKSRASSRDDVVYVVVGGQHDI